jgi:galactoside O-acetyltransferase
MPNVIFDEGAVCGAFSFIKNSLKKWSIYCGIPAKKIKNRSKKILDFDIK